jgi:hypothetical protein
MKQIRSEQCVLSYHQVSSPWNRTWRPWGGELRYRSTFSSTSMLEGVGGQCHAPAGKETQNLFYRKLGGRQGQSVSPPLGFNTHTDSPTCGKSLYWLGYPGPHHWVQTFKILTAFLRNKEKSIKLSYAETLLLYIQVVPSWNISQDSD